MEFKDRLVEYRKELNIKTKQKMADKLGIARTLYSMLENGERKPSQGVLDKLFILSNKPEEYWLYGISESEYVKNREELKMTKRAVKQLIDIKMITNENIDNFNDSVKDVLLAALKADIKHMLLKEKEEH